MSVKINKSFRKQGFTLLEMIISLSIIGIIILVISGAMRLGVNSMDKGDRKINSLERIRSSMNIMDSQVQSLFPFKYKEDGVEKIYFSGNGNSLMFSTNYSAWGPEWGYISVKYRVVEDNNGSFGLQSIENVLGRERLRTLKLFDSLKGIYFEYLSQKESEDGKIFEWVDSWESDKSIPTKIRVHLLYEEKEYSFTLPVRVSILPDKQNRMRPLRRKQFG
jgi:general secretion pathway protein J